MARRRARLGVLILCGQKLAEEWGLAETRNRFAQRRGRCQSDQCAAFAAVGRSRRLAAGFAGLAGRCLPDLANTHCTVCLNSGQGPLSVMVVASAVPPQNPTMWCHAIRAIYRIV
jgi:hypothetical protein